MKSVRAVVQGVRPGRHGKFAIATAEGFEGSITFSLKKGVWQEDDLPECGSVVILSDLRKKRAGWRAMGGRYLRPSDQQSATSKEQVMTEEKKTVPNTEEEMKNPAEMLMFLLNRASGRDPVLVQKAEGAKSFNESNVLPRRMSEKDKSALEAAGVKFLGECPNDELFQFAELPKGWQKVSNPPDPRHIGLYDQKGRRRAHIFYKAAFYDRKANLSIVGRFSIRSDWERQRDENMIVLQVFDQEVAIFSTEPTQLPEDCSWETASQIEADAKQIATDWLEEQYPNWRDPAAYWD